MALQELSNQLGSCRMLQVARQDSKSFPTAHSSEPSILPILKRRLKHLQKALKASLANINRTALLASLHQCCIDPQQVRAKSIFKKLQKAMFQVGEAADHAPKDPEKRHQIRILIKKINIFLDDFGVKNERLGT